MLQANNHSPRRITPNHQAADAHGQRTSSPSSFARAGLYPVAPAAGQASHPSPSNPAQPNSLAVPRNMDSSMDRVSDLSPAQLSELMHSGRPWWAKELGMTKNPSRASHQRESSLTSTLGSTGPNSPCSPNMPTPHIAVSDSIDDTFRDSQGGNSYYHFAPEPAPVPQDQFLFAEPQVYGLQMNGQPAKNPYAMDGFAAGRATEPPPGMDTPYSPGVHQSIPMTSSASAPMANSMPPFRHSPSGLQTSGESIEGSRQRREAIPDVPKLDRTMTDIYNDNLYNPNLDIISSASPSAAPSSPSDDMFSQRLDAAGALGDGYQGRGAAGRVPVPASYPTGDPGSHRTQLFQDPGDAHSPQTISPQDSMLDFSETDARSTNFPLFPKPEPNGFGAMDALSQGGYPQGNYQGGAAGNNLPYIPAETTSALFPSQDFPVFGSQQDARMSGTMHPGESTSAEWMGHGQRPTQNRDGGTYSCTYHGCTQRFETPSLLQKHKREGHRQANSLKSAPGAAKSSAMDTQAGPHRCQRINPGTGKICKAVFSRPYDLTRHEDTIHNARKQKVRCDLCTEEKLFSRADALTRHYRVCHPDVELPGKHKRRRPGSQS